MASKAWRAFNRNAQDVKRLLEIHRKEGGSARGRRHRLEVLNKSAVMLITAFWEAYCEDIAAEALDHIVHHVRHASKLPKELKKRLSKDIKADKNEIAMWELADEGWRSRVKIHLATLTEERNRKLNTPKSADIDRLFAEAIGLESISDKWRWERMLASKAKKKLDKYVSLRGAIAHRGKAASSCTKTQVVDYFDFLKHLVSKTGGEVNKFVRSVTGKPLW